MELSLTVASVAIGGNLLLGVGLIATWVKNGKSQAAKYGTLEAEVKSTGEKVDIMSGKVDKFAVTLGRQDERLITNEREIKELRTK